MKPKRPGEAVPAAESAPRFAPAHAIPANVSQLYGYDACISRMRCIKVCPVHARRLNPVMLRTAESAFTKNTTHGGSRNSFYKK